MGDRCYLSIAIRKQDQEAFGVILECGKEDWYDEVSVEGDKYMEVVCYEANYGWHDEIDAAADQGLVFQGHHGSGGQYGPGCFAGIDGDYSYISVDEEGYAVVRVSEDGEINGNQYFDAMEYYKRVDRVKEELYGRKQ